MSHGVHAVQHEVEHRSSTTSTATAKAAATRSTPEHPEQARGAADRGDRAVPRVLRDARQERPDQCAEFPDRGLQSLELLSGQEHPPDLTWLRRADEGRPGRRPEEHAKTAMTKQIDEWAKTAARYRSEPEAANGKGEGTVELSRRALEEQAKRDICARQVSPLRGGLGRVPDRHRAGVGDRHHRHGGAGYLRSVSAWSVSASWRSGCSPARGAFVLNRASHIVSPRIARRMR